MENNNFNKIIEDYYCCSPFHASNLIKIIFEHYLIDNSKYTILINDIKFAEMNARHAMDDCITNIDIFNIEISKVEYKLSIFLENYLHKDIVINNTNHHMKLLKKYFK